MQENLADPAVAWNHLSRTDLTAPELAEIARLHPSFRSTVASHPAAPAGLVDWIRQQGQPNPSTPAPAATRSAKTPWIVAACALLLAAGGVTWGLTRPSADPGTSASSTATASLDAAVVELDFATPEEAIRHAAANLAGGNTQEALRAFAISSLADGWNYEAFLDRSRMVMPYGPVSAQSPYFRDIFAAQRLGEITVQFRSIFYGLILPEWLQPLAKNQSVQVTDEHTGADVIAALDTARMKNLTIQQIVEETAISSRPSNVKFLEARLKEYGAADLKEFGVLYEFEGQTYLGGATVLRYGESWHLLSLSSVLLGVDSSGNLEPITKEEFTEKLAG